jgi:hypothetical protein
MTSIEDLLQPIFFGSRVVGEALDNYDYADPHRRADEFDDPETAPRVNQPLYDTSTSTPLRKSNIDLDILPDYSDEIMSEYRIKQLLGQPLPDVSQVVDLDTAPDYVDFIKNSIRTIISSENEFNLDNKENVSKDVTQI